MRKADALALAWGSLWQRRTRTLLTLVGVVVGSFVLIASLAIGRGVEDMIVGQLRKQDQLRRIAVWSAGEPPRRDVPQKEPEVTGTMSEARRNRLREAIRRREKEPIRGPSRNITPKQIAALGTLEHVEEVVPGISWVGTATWASKSHRASIRVTGATDASVARRVVAGRMLLPGEEAVLVDEYLVYTWGLRDEQEVQRVFEQPVRLAFQSGQPGVGTLLFLLNLNGADLAPDEIKQLEGLLKRLPGLLPRLDLPEKERALLARLAGKAPTGERRGITREVVAVGVFRDVERAELNPWDWPADPTDVVASPKLAESLMAAMPSHTPGWPRARVQVTSEAQLRNVEARIKAMGLETFSFAEFLDQVRLNILLISIACTIVAAVALTVAALGITNTMLMSVLERTHEIGVMKATGATDADVLLLFLLEAAVIGVTGSLVGLLLAWLAAWPGDALARYIVASQTPMVLEGSIFRYPLWLTVGVPALVSGLTTLAGVYPARRAARIDPIVALRQR